MFKHIITTIQLLGIIWYSFLVNKLYYNDEIAHQLYCINNITKLNMLFIKFMQWISSQNISPRVQQVIRDFADNVPYTKDDIDYQLFDELIETAQKHNNVLQINYTPINSGTIALVYEGTLNNKSIIIKQLRKNIINELHESITLMKFMGSICDLIPYLSLFQLREIIDINEPFLIKQANFHDEVENIKHFEKVFKNNSEFVFPHVYEELTTKNVIVMEKLIGRKVQSLTDEELPQYCEMYNRLLVESLIEKRVIHSDMHLGNIFFMEDYKLGLIDFGYINHINSDLSKKITLFYKFMFNKQIKKLTKLCFDDFIEFKNMKDNEEKRHIVLKEVEAAFNNENILSGKRPMNINDIMEVNRVLKPINANLKHEFMNLILSMAPACSVVSILKRNDNENSLKEVFKKYVFNKVPSSLKDYNE